MCGLGGIGLCAFHFIISLSVWLIAYAILFGAPNATVLLLPLVVFR